MLQRESCWIKLGFTISHKKRDFHLFAITIMSKTTPLGHLSPPLFIITHQAQVGPLFWTKVFVEPKTPGRGPEETPIRPNQAPKVTVETWLALARTCMLTFGQTVETRLLLTVLSYLYKNYAQKKNSCKQIVLDLLKTNFHFESFWQFIWGLVGYIG